MCINECVLCFRVSYIEFLRPYAMKREVWKHGNNLNDLMAHPRKELPINDIGEPPQKGLVGISSKLRQKVRVTTKNNLQTFSSRLTLSTSISGMYTPSSLVGYYAGFAAVNNLAIL